MKTKEIQRMALKRLPKLSVDVENDDGEVVRIDDVNKDAREGYAQALKAAAEAIEKR